MRATRFLTALLAGTALLVSCGGDDRLVDATPDATAHAPADLAARSPAPASPAAPAAPAVPATEETPGVAPRPADATATARVQVTLAQPAIWPAPEVVFATPEEAAADFVSEVLGVSPVLGAFQLGDSRSGEIEVLSPGDGGGTPLVRGILILRQLGPTDGWYVIGAASDGVSIDAPPTQAVVTATPLTVSGRGRGFEGTLNVIAFTAGDVDDQLDLVIAQGGAFADTEPYSATVDLSAADPGDQVALLVRGDTGLETDPGEFSAILVVIADELPASR